MFPNSQEGISCFRSQLWLCGANVNKDEQMEKLIPSDLLLPEHLHSVCCRFWTYTDITMGKDRESGVS